MNVYKRKKKKFYLIIFIKIILNFLLEIGKVKYEMISFVFGN